MKYVSIDNRYQFEWPDNGNVCITHQEGKKFYVMASAMREFVAEVAATQVADSVRRLIRGN